FALFLVLFAYAGRSGAVEGFTSAMRESLGQGGRDPGASPPRAASEPLAEPFTEPPPVAPFAPEDPREPLRERLTNCLGPEFSTLVEVRAERRGVVVALVDSPLLFDTGRAEIRPAGARLLERLAAVQRDTGLEVRIEGHTDNVPIRNERYRSNWELSVLRASSVAEHLIRRNGVEPDRLSVMGYGEHRPKESNATEEGRADNRRVEVIFLVEDL
ncbi:MAG: flagellar motor protein MotB, partial [Candidatus Eremiobacterota bacterium]